MLFGSPGSGASVTSGGIASASATVSTARLSLGVGAATVATIGTAETAALSVRGVVVLVIVVLLHGDEALVVGAILAEELTTTAATSASTASAALGVALLSKKAGVFTALNLASWACLLFAIGNLLLFLTLIGLSGHGLFFLGGSLGWLALEAQQGLTLAA